MGTSDNIEHNKLQLALQGSETLSFTESEDYQLNSLEIPHNLGYVPIAVVYYWLQIGEVFSQVIDDYSGTPIPDIEEGFAEPWTPYAYNKFFVNKDSLVVYRQSMHTSDALPYRLSYKYFLFSNPAYA